MTWIEPGKEKPKALERVLVSYLGRYSKNPSISVAVYIPPNTVRSEDFLNEDCDPGDLDTYVEAEDAYFVNESWFEASLESEQNTVLDGNIMHWCHLPLPPETFI